MSTRFRFAALVALLCAGVPAVFAAEKAEPAFEPVPIDADAGSVSALARWQMQSSAKVQQSGADVSRAEFSAKDWFRVSARATVMAGLLENGLYPDVFYSDNLRAVQVPDASGNQFVVPWWYRTQFTLAKPASGAHTLLRTNGLIASADVWLNGHAVADHRALAGAYPVHEFDVTPWVHEGANTLALRVYPDDPQRSLVIGWVDWNPMPPDFNMGPWRGVDILRTGPVRLSSAEVIPALSLPDMERAALTVKVDASNLDSVPHDVMLSGEAAGVALGRRVHLDPGQTLTVAFSPATDAGLELHQPKVWWPVGMGDHPLYRLELSAAVDGASSDRASATFGIRAVSSRFTRQGQRQFLVNGKPVLIRGAGWSPDIFLRENPQRLQAEFRHVLNLGLNTIRSEGKLEDQRFYDLADAAGIMILPGWECCDKWEAWSETGGEPWSDADREIAAASMASEARLLRNHPSVIGFLIGSDNAPPPSIAKMYTDVLRAADWSTPVVAAASKRVAAEPGSDGTAPAPIAAVAARGAAGAYPSGMKMDGPYDWVPPIYWYADQLGGAFGFDAEMSAGATIPRGEDLARMLTPQEQDALWRYAKIRQYHAADSWSPFATLEPFDTALAKRYGAPKDLADYVTKAQLDNYDNVRAQFEAFNAHENTANPATGVIYWMLNSAWPSLHWSLYDYYLNPAGAYFGAKKANEPLHIQYAYDTRAVVLVNHAAAGRHALQARIRVRDLDGGVSFDRQVKGIDLASNQTRQLATLSQPKGTSTVYFIELELAAADGQPLSRNVYWLSTRPDRLDWANSNWYLTPVLQYADFTALQAQPTAASDVQVATRHEGAEDVTTVTLANPASAKAVALFQQLALKSAHGDLVPNVLWSDNDVTLWPGESLTVTARYATPTAGVVLEVDGWNSRIRQFPLAVREADGAAQGASH